MLTKKELNKLNKGEFFNNKYIIGNGSSGYVYNINECIVVKKLDIFTTWKELKNEFETTILLSMLGLAPKVIFHSKKNDKFKYYVMEKLDYTLYYMLKNKIFTEYHLGKLNYIFNKLIKTNYRHGDLHFKNIMWSNYYKEFRIIDWGKYYFINNNKSYDSDYNTFINRINYLMNNEYKIYTFLGLKICKIKCLK